MAKSTRSKVKRHFRAKKRTEGVFAVADAARLNRLHQKLRVLVAQNDDPEEVMEVEEGAGEGEEPGAQSSKAQQSRRGVEGSNTDSMDLDPTQTPTTPSTTTRISTHGPRDSRREQWRLSKGLPARAPSKGVNRQGVVGARRKAGRSHRRR